MPVCAYASPLKLGYELIDRRSILISGDNNRIDFKIITAEFVDQPHDLQVICDSEVLPCLTLDYISGINTDDDFRFVAHLLQELDLGILVKARQDSHCMLVFYKLAAKFKVKPSLSAVNSFKDVFGLFFDVFLCAESDFFHTNLLSLSI